MADGRTDYRGYVRATAWHGQKVQRAALLEAGVPIRALYVDERGKLGRREECIRALRHGDTLVVYGLFTLGTNRHDLAEVLAQVVAKRTGILCARSGRSFAPTDAIAAIADVTEAITEWAGEKHNPDRRLAAEKGRKGGKAGVRRVERKMGDREARKIWLGPGSERERLERMPGWNRPSAYRYLGARKPKKR